MANLDQTKLRIIGAISHKLCVDSEIGSLRPFFTKGDEFVSVINEHERSIFRSSGWLFVRA